MLALPSAACYTTHHQPIGPNTSLKNAAGITTRSGNHILFAKPGATIANDTLFAIATIGPVKVPIDSIAEVTSQGFSAGGSLVVIGVFLAVVSAALYLSVASLARIN